MERHLLALLVIGFSSAVPGNAYAACSCTSMTVTFGGDQDICSNNDFDVGVDFTECQKAAGGHGTACPNHAFIYTCPTGVNSQAGLEQKTGFKIAAAYGGGSNADDCTPGQILQETITSDQGVVQPTINPTSLDGDQTLNGYDTTIDNDATHPFPQVGAMTAAGRNAYGGDNYIAGAVDVISGQSDAGSNWWDNPDQNKDDAGENATWQFRFLSYVRGSGGVGGGSCSCAFDIDVTWAANMAPVTTFTPRADGSENCP